MRRSPYLVLICTLLLAEGISNSGRAQDPEGSTVSAADTLKHSAEPKSPTGALLRSMVLPGWGQWYNGKKIKAGIAFVAESALIARIVIVNRQVHDATSEPEAEYYRERRNVTFWWLGGAILFSMLDAYVDAYLSDFDAGPNLSARVQPLAHESPGMSLALKLRF